jgi:hypothetical protein
MAWPAGGALETCSGDDVKGFTKNGLIRLNANPTLLFEAIPNGFQLRSGEIASFNPLAMWNTHYIRELDDSGYVE